MNDQKFQIALAFTTLFLVSCITPQEAIDKGQYTKAMKISTRKILKGKDVAANQEHLLTAAAAITDERIDNYYSINSESIKTLKVEQDKFNDALSAIGKNNLKTQGLVSDSYNKLCDVKYDLDIQIVDYYYDEGNNLLAVSKSTGKKSPARDAYREFVLSEKEGANTFYNDLTALKEESVEHGSITVDAPRFLRSRSPFIKFAEGTSNTIPDCYVSTSTGAPRVYETSSISTREFSRRVKVGERAITDTSGVTRYEDIFQNVYAYEETETINFTAQQSLNINVTANTEECFLADRNLTFRETDSCREVTVLGDSRAYRGQSRSTCNKSGIRNKLTRELDSEISSNLYIE